MTESSGSCAAISVAHGFNIPMAIRSVTTQWETFTHRHHEHRSSSHSVIPLCSGSSLLRWSPHITSGTVERTRARNRTRLMGPLVLRCYLQATTRRARLDWTGLDWTDGLRPSPPSPDRDVPARDALRL